MGDIDLKSNQVLDFIEFFIEEMSKKNSKEQTETKILEKIKIILLVEDMIY